MSAKLARIQVTGFKSIANVDIALGQLNVLIGANGSGKSNLISFFRLLNHMLSAPTGNLQVFVAEQGGAASLLHDGPKRTPQIEAELEIDTDQGTNNYSFRLFFSAVDRLIFAEEKCRYSQRNKPQNPKWLQFGSGHPEAEILRHAHDHPGMTARVISQFMRKFAVYQFHDTSRNARIKTKWDKDDCHYMKHDAANLGPFLLKVRDTRADHYRIIVETIRQVLPFFDDFVLEPERDSLILQWRERGSDIVFSAHQASDGMLRAVALITLLLQPPEWLPELLVIDEPELGLHPYAITIIAGLIRAASCHSQILLATQSTLFLDQFDAEDVIVVDRNGRASEFRRLDAARLKSWLQDYTLGELWQRNILGGRPKASAA